MNIKILNTLAILLLVASVSCDKFAFDALEAVKNHQFKNNVASQQILDVVQLELKSGGSIDNIIKLLNNLVADLHDQQEKADVQFTQDKQDLNKLIKKYTRLVKIQIERIEQLQLRITKTYKLISITKHAIKVSLQQIKIASARIDELNTLREIDRKAYQKRYNRQSEMLKAVNYLITELEKFQSVGAFVDLAQVKEKLQQLVRQNPIEALVQLTMTFDQKSVQKAIKKLNQIKTALSESLVDEEKQELQAQKQFVGLRDELQSFLDQVDKQLEKQQATLASLHIELKQLKQQLAANQKLLVSYKVLIVQFKKQLKRLILTYNQQKAQRNSEVSTLQKAIKILRDGAPASNRAETYKFSN